jgi:hypothetical protein
MLVLQIQTTRVNYANGIVRIKLKLTRNGQFLADPMKRQENLRTKLKKMRNMVIKEKLFSNKYLLKILVFHINSVDNNYSTVYDDNPLLKRLKYFFDVTFSFNY